MKFLCAVLLILVGTINLILSHTTPESCLKNQAECLEKEMKESKLVIKLCGSNNVTYKNSCSFEMDLCLGKNISVKHLGRCRSKKLCFKEVEEIRKNKKPDSFVPRCLKNGDYSPIQCHNGTGYCWCVTRKGKIIPNSAKPYQQPNCYKKFKMRRRASIRKHNKDVCGQKDKQKFGQNLLNLFRAEYGKDLEDGVDTSLLNQKILNWKFQSVDRNNDGFLQRSEYKVLRKLKKLIKPKKCAKMLAKICDTDHDKKISKQEWSSCLGIRMTTLKGSPVASLSGKLPGYEQINRQDEQEINDCFSDRQAVLSEQRSSNLYVPECTVDGRYEKIQCYKSTGYCWCVNEDDGKPIPGTSVKDMLPKCDSVPSPVRPMKGCPGEKKDIFLKELIDFLAKKLVSKNESHFSSENVVVISFSTLDANNNKYLEKKEWKAFRALVVSNRSLRRCGKRLPRFCDINNDRRISLTEWSNCLHRRGPNPLESYLKEDD